MLRTMTNRVYLWGHRRRANDESGQGLAEYALILALVALACIVALGALGQGIASSPGFSLFP
jgi:Flp pilus assembly pilin Flp